MKKSRTLLLFTSFLIYQFPDQLISQNSFFGYYETEMDQMRYGGVDYLFGYNKVRLDLEVSPMEKAIFRTNFTTQLYHGQRQWDLFDFLPDRVTSPLVDGGIEQFPFMLQDTLYLDNAYLKLSFAPFDFTVGKQQLSLGTGYTWNPLDIFNTKELLDPTYEQTGVNAIRFEVPLADRFLMDVIVSPAKELSSSTGLIQGKLGLGRFDLTATVGTYEWNLTGFDPSSLQLLAVKEARQMIGTALVGELLGWGLWWEGSWISVKDKNDFSEYLIGLDHTFDFSTYFLVEYYHNGGGVRERDDLQMGDYFSYFSGQSHSLMQDYLFLLMNHPLTDLVSAGLFGIVNFNDNSAFVSPLVDYSLFENVNLNLLFIKTRGDADSEFGLQDWGVRIRMRTYF